MVASIVETIKITGINPDGSIAGDRWFLRPQEYYITNDHWDAWTRDLKVWDIILDGVTYTIPDSCLALTEKEEPSEDMRSEETRRADRNTTDIAAFGKPTDVIDQAMRYFGIDISAKGTFDVDVPRAKALEQYRNAMGKKKTK